MTSTQSKWIALLASGEIVYHDAPSSAGAKHALKIAHGVEVVSIGFSNDPTYRAILSRTVGRVEQ